MVESDVTQAAVQMEESTSVAVATSNIGETQESTTISEPKDREGSIKSPTSWWGYIGFRTAESGAGDPSSPSEKSQTILANPSKDDASLLEPDVPAESSVSNSAVVSAGANPAIVSDTPSQTRIQSSLWDTPWSWYTSASPSTALQSSIPQDGLVTPDQSAAVKEPSDSIGERILDERHIASEHRSETSPAPEPPNPIQSSISSHKPAWSYLFSSKALSMKAITASEHPRDENGMEIMDLDDDDNSGIRSSPAAAIGVDTPPTPASPPNKSGTSTQVLDVNRLKRTIMVLKGSDAGTGTRTPPTPPATPCTATEPVKRENGKIDGKKSSSSPAPSTKTLPASPPKPAPPNLILPAWEDIFHSPPRSIAPSQTTSRFLKAIKAMSGVLFSLEQDQHSARKEKFREFGKALPRAWEVIENPTGSNRQLDILRGCKRVVVIGIHGWFPGACNM